MPEPHALEGLTLDELEAEVTRLRAALARAGENPEHPDHTLAETQERYRLAAKATNDAIWDWDLTANLVLWNDALERAYGHPVSTETTGDWWIAQIHPDDQARIEASIHAVIDGGGIAWADGYRFRRFDGSYAEVHDRGHVIRSADGQAVRMIGAMLDLTPIRTTEAALRKSEERFRTILETTEAAFAIVQVKFDHNDSPVDYRFVEANRAFERQAGVDLRGKWVTEYVPDLERFWFETYGHVVKTGEPATFENYAKGFARWFDVRAVRIGDPDDRQIAILFEGDDSLAAVFLTGPFREKASPPRLIPASRSARKRWLTPLPRPLQFLNDALLG